MCLNMFRSVKSIARNVLTMLYSTFFGEQGVPFAMDGMDK